MATLTITIPNPDVSRLQAAYCSKYNYRPTLDGGVINPESAAQFANRMVKADMKRTVAEYEQQLAINSAIAGVVEPDIT